MKRGVLALLLVVSVVLSACGADRPAAEAITEKQVPTVDAAMDDGGTKGEDAMEEDTSGSQAVTNDAMSKDDEMMEQEATKEEGSMDDAMSGDEAMKSDETLEDAEAMDEGAMPAPAWYSVELMDVNTGESFRVADFEGKVVLVETLAVWCTTCLRQQKEIRALHEALGERDDLISVGLNIDPNENADILKAHTDKNGFDWRYAVVSREVAREIGQLYGDQFLNPPSAPMLIIDRQGQGHPLPFGVKSAEALQEALSPFLK
jgi:hypothetical protein